MEMKKHLKSRAGWFLVVIYLIVAFFSFWEALTCTGILCDLAALPAVIPLGLPVAWFTDWIDYLFSIPGHVPSFHFRNWYFIIPTVIANSVFYYWLGSFSVKLFRRLRNKFSGKN